MLEIHILEVELHHEDYKVVQERRKLGGAPAEGIPFRR